jgi:predicted RND superfamily exporter protein
VVGFSYAVHVVSAAYEAQRGELGPTDPHGPVFVALRHVLLPVLLTGATTAAGFLSLATSRLGAIQEFGVFCALGVCNATLVSLVFAPALLQVLRTPRLRERRSSDRVDRLLTRLARFDLRHRRLILAAGAGVALLSLVGMSRIQVSTNIVRNFPADSRVRKDFDAVNEHLEGSNSFYVVVEADERDAFMEPGNLAVVRQIQDWLEQQPEVGGTTSFVDYLRVINEAFHDDDPAYLSIPESKDLVAQLLLFSSDPEFENFVDSEYDTANVVVRAKVFDSGLVSDLSRRIERYLATLPDDLRYQVTGNAILVSRTIDDIALGQTLSLSTAFVIIFAILALLFTSLRIGFLALLPNILPVLVYFGVLGFSGIALDTVTGLVACLVLGIAVDDTIHFLAQFNRSSKTLADESRGVVEAMRSVGRPVTYTTAALCIGFLTLTLSELRNQVEFGALASFTLAVAWLADVTFTPALAARLRIVTLWDVLSLDLGDDPRRSIPLFAGLRETQARIIALMASLRRFPKGHRLFHAGESGDEMYVVIDGELLVSLRTERGEVRFGTCKRGDAVGEVALFHGQRTADVQALTDVRLLRLTHASLERIRRRYPRIGAQLYRNLSYILADRVASTTAKL